MMFINRIENTLPYWCQHVIASNKHVILDTQTTGKYGEVIEIAVIDIRGNILLNQLLCPKVAVDLEMTRVHRITAPMLAKAPRLPDIWPYLQDCLDGKSIITYNAWFDSKRLAHSASLYDLTHQDWTFYCMMNAYANYWRAPIVRHYYPWQKLGAACNQQNVDLSELTTFRALGDAQTTLALIKGLAAQGERAPTYQSTNAFIGTMNMFQQWNINQQYL